jgi:predicted nuclease with TOPRIM domain
MNVRSDDMTCALLNMYPSTTLCGKTVLGNVASEEHERGCVECWKKKYEEKEKECKNMKISLSKRQVDVNRLEARVRVLESEHARIQQHVRGRSSSVRGPLIRQRHARSPSPPPPSLENIDVLSSLDSDSETTDNEDAQGDV